MRPSERWIPIGRACEFLGVNPSTLRQWADRGLVRAFRTVGGHRRFSGEDLRELMTRAAATRASHESLSDTALRRIRRQLQTRRGSSPPWHELLDDTARGRLRLLGRRLLGLTETYLTQRRKRASLLEEVRFIGEEYGLELARQRISLRDVLEAFIFFRHSLFVAVRLAPGPTSLPPDDRTQTWLDVEIIADELLLHMTDAYERSRDGLTAVPA